MSDPAPKPSRRIACVRCRRTKKKCDHSVPVCGQCRRAGVECRQLRTQRTGDSITVPLSYFQHLEAKAHAADAELDRHRHALSPPTTHAAQEEELTVQSWSSPNALHIPPTPPSVGNSGPEPDPATPWFDSYADRVLLDDQDNISADGRDRDKPGVQDESSQARPAPSIHTAYHLSPRLLPQTNAFQRPEFDTQPTENASLDITWSIELYANIYLAHVHKMYPFLSESSVRSWMRTCARGYTLEGAHKGFMLRLLCAIGALMCSSFADDCPHLKEATLLSQQAFERFHSGAMRQGGVVRSQICLLALFYATYGSQPESIHKAHASAVAECAQLSDCRNQDSPSRSSVTVSEDAGDPDELINNIILACHQVNEIIACGWDRSDEDFSRSLDDKLSICIDRLPASQTSGWTHLRPYHKMRKIQHKIRLFHEAAERWGLDREAKSKWKAEIVQDVEDWKANLPQSGDETGSGSYAPYSMCYTEKLSDYTICLLHEADPSSMGVEDLYALLAASSDACRKYRLTQASNKGIMLRNWNTLAYQFRAGILVLYCVWATPVSLRTPAYSSVETAVNDCSDTLLDFAKRWPVARPFHETFTCLVAQTPFDSASATAEALKFPEDEASKMEGLLAKLRGLRTHRSVLSIIEAMIQWQPQSLIDLEVSNPLWAVGLDSMDIFELGQTAYGMDMFSLDL